ncbi:MAG: HD family hydrolase [Candidatus Hadarchaeales archaeon]
MLELLRKLNNLKHLPRTGWSFCSIPPSETEDVAQHTFEVASICLLLSEGLEVNREKVLKLALIHDWPEAVVGDFSYTALPFLGGKEVKGRIEDRALQSFLGNEKELVELWREGREDRTPEARLVRFSDYLSILLQALHYFERGNRSQGLRELCENVCKDLDPYLSFFPQFKPLVDELRALLRF